MKNDETLYRLYVLQTNKIILTRAQNLKPCSSEQLPWVAALSEGISRKLDDGDNKKIDMENQAEEIITQAFSVYRSSLFEAILYFFTSPKRPNNDRIPKYFTKSLRDTTCH